MLLLEVFSKAKANKYKNEVRHCFEANVVLLAIVEQNLPTIWVYDSDQTLSSLQATITALNGKYHLPDDGISFFDCSNIALLLFSVNMFSLWRKCVDGPFSILASQITIIAFFLTYALFFLILRHSALSHVISF